MTDILGFHHVNLSVRDLAKSLAWYTELLGFSVYKEMPDDGQRGAKVVMVHPGSKILLGLTSHSANAGETFDEHRTGMDHVAFAVPNRASLEAWMQRFSAAGVAHALSSTGSLVTFRDPDNIQLQVYSYE